MNIIYQPHLTMGTFVKPTENTRSQQTARSHVLLSVMLLTLLVGWMSFSNLAWAESHAHQHTDHSSMHHASDADSQKVQSHSGSVDSNDLTNAEVKRVQMQQGKITLKHEYIHAIDMPPMTMTFTVSDPDVLKSLQRGDKVRFSTTEKMQLIHIEKRE